jgi:hypothetical protein
VLTFLASTVAVVPVCKSLKVTQPLTATGAGVGFHARAPHLGIPLNPKQTAQP